MVSGQTVFGIVGWKGSGKTTLMVALVADLTARGLRVSTVKHAHHAFDVDQPGKDSYQHRQAGATEVLVASRNRWALMHELRGEPEADLASLLTRLAPADLVLVEGFKHDPHDKLEVHRRGIKEPLLADGDPHILAVATDVAGNPAQASQVPLLDLNDVPAIADFIIRHCGLAVGGTTARAS